MFIHPPLNPAIDMFPSPIADQIGDVVINPGQFELFVDEVSAIVIRFVEFMELG